MNFNRLYLVNYENAEPFYRINVGQILSFIEIPEENPLMIFSSFIKIRESEISFPPLNSEVAIRSSLTYLINDKKVLCKVSSIND